MRMGSNSRPAGALVPDCPSKLPVGPCPRQAPPKRRQNLVSNSFASKLPIRREVNRRHIRPQSADAVQLPAEPRELPAEPPKVSLDDAAAAAEVSLDDAATAAENVAPKQVVTATVVTAVTAATAATAVAAQVTGQVATQSPMPRDITQAQPLLQPLTPDILHGRRFRNNRRSSSTSGRLLEAGASMKLLGGDDERPDASSGSASGSASGSGSASVSGYSLRLSRAPRRNRKLPRLLEGIISDDKLLVETGLCDQSANDWLSLSVSLLSTLGGTGRMNLVPWCHGELLMAPLAVAVTLASATAVETLLANGADAAQTDWYGQCPLHILFPKIPSTLGGPAAPPTNIAIPTIAATAAAAAAASAAASVAAASVANDWQPPAVLLGGDGWTPVAIRSGDAENVWRRRQDAYYPTYLSSVRKLAMRLGAAELRLRLRRIAELLCYKVWGRLSVFECQDADGMRCGDLARFWIAQVAPASSALPSSTADTWTTFAATVLQDAAHTILQHEDLVKARLLQSLITPLRTTPKQENKGDMTSHYLCRGRERLFRVCATETWSATETPENLLWSLLTEAMPLSPEKKGPLTDVYNAVLEFVG